MKFPDFIIVGFMKGGTTSLWHNMSKHPSITMCRQDGGGAGSGIKFWEHVNKKKGIEWYKGLFSGEISGEKSLYGHSKKSMAAIAKQLPDIKLIFVMRNPVDRGYSEYQMSVRRQKAHKLYDFHIGSVKYSKKGQYLQILQDNILPFFPKENLHFVINERMRADINAELNKIYSFVGADEFHCKTEQFESPTGIKKSDNPVHKKRDEYQSWVSQYEPLNGELRQQLLNFHASNNEKLFQFLGYSVPEWQA